MEEKDFQIVSIAAKGDTLYGLDKDGELFVFNEQVIETTDEQSCWVPIEIWLEK